MNASDQIRVQHMIEAAREALGIAGSRPRTELLEDRVATLAAMKDLEIIGEAASKISAEVRAERGRIPWAEIVGMRNRLIHAYFDVVTEVVWDTVVGDLPVLVVELERILDGARGDRG